ncbi:hypothetical protein ACFCVU_10760 [Peribacillus butanolivorans]|uniref:hypothetical protein n=1 Tax=Peribacillus butanolivorans TaxID=421767 RepID=UPI0035E0267F
MSESPETHGSQCCNCVEEMAEQLKKFEQFFSDVYEGNKAILSGTIDRVIDGEVLRMTNVQKLLFTPSSGTFGNFYNELFISICEITEFSPLFAVTAATDAQVTTMQKQMLLKTKAIKVR